MDARRNRSPERRDLSRRMPAGYMAVLFALALAAPHTALAHPSDIITVSFHAEIGDGDAPAVYDVAITCTEAVLAYGVGIFVPYNDSEDHYAIPEDSMRLGGVALNNTGHSLEVGHAGINLLDGRASGYPLLVPQYHPLVIPVLVLDDAPGLPAEAILDFTYEGGPDTACWVSELHGTQTIGLMARTGVERGIDRIVAAEMSVADYNEYLETVGGQWRLELAIKDSGSDPETALNMAKEFAAEGVDIIVGPSSSSAITALREYTGQNDMLVISCCSTAPSLALPDHIFRTTPDDTHQAKALARVIADDGIGSIVIVHRNDTYGRGLAGALAAEMQERGGGVAAAIPYHSDTARFDGITQSVADAVRGADGAAVVAISSVEAAALIESAMNHHILYDTKWYGSEAVVNHRGVTQGHLGSFAERVGLSGVIVAALPGPVKDDVERRLIKELNLKPGESPSTFLYSMYDAILILAKAVTATQSVDARTLVDAIPHVAARTHGAMTDTLNENGDLVAPSYGVWQVRDSVWTRTGTFVEGTDEVLPYGPPN